jgi:hypothetical protein
MDNATLQAIIGHLNELKMDIKGRESLGNECEG